jgi:hypothetical protein
MGHLTADATGDRSTQKEEAHKQLTKKKAHEVPRAGWRFRRRTSGEWPAASTKSASIQHASAENEDEEVWNTSNVR